MHHFSTKNINKTILSRGVPSLSGLSESKTGAMSFKIPYFCLTINTALFTCMRKAAARLVSSIFTVYVHVYVYAPPKKN